MTHAKYNPPDNRYIPIDIPFAREYGVNEAMIFAKLWRLMDKWQGKVDDNGQKWVRISLDEWVVELPLKDRTIRRTIEICEEKGLILSRTFTGRCKWYRCNPEYVEVTGQNVHMQVDKMDSPTGQNGQLPNSLPNSVPSLSKKENPPKTTKPKKQQQKPNPADIEYYNPLSQELLTVCSLAVPLVNGTKLDFTGVIKFLQANHATPDMVRNFGQWYEKTPNLKAITENWKLFIEGKQPRHKQFNGKGASKNGNQNNGSGTGIKLTPEQKQKADELNRQIEAAAATKPN